MKITFLGEIKLMKEKYLQSQTTSAEVFIIFSPSCPAFSMQFILRELYCIITLRENADYGSAIDLLIPGRISFEPLSVIHECHKAAARERLSSTPCRSR